MNSLSSGNSTEAIQDVIASIVQAAQFIPSSKEDLIEYINEHGFDVDEISREVLYRCDSALISEGVIDECVVKIANYLGIESLDDDYLVDYRDYIIDELIDQSRALNKEEFLNSYENPLNYIVRWIDTCLREYLTENPEEIGLNEDEDDYSDKIEEWLDNIHKKTLDPIYQEAEEKLSCSREENY
jgi:hypothetical protein